MGALHNTGQDEVGTSTHLRYRPATNRFPHRRTCAPSCLRSSRSRTVRSLCRRCTGSSGYAHAGDRRLGPPRAVKRPLLSRYQYASRPPVHFVPLGTGLTSVHVWRVMCAQTRWCGTSPLLPARHPPHDGHTRSPSRPKTGARPSLLSITPYTMVSLGCSLRRLYLFGGWNGRSDFDTLHVLVRASSCIRQGVRSLDVLTLSPPFADMSTPRG